MVSLTAQKRDADRVEHMFQIALKILGGLVVLTLGIGIMFP